MANEILTLVGAAPMILSDTDRSHIHTQEALVATADFGIHIQVVEIAELSFLVIAFHH